MSAIDAPAKKNFLTRTLSGIVMLAVVMAGVLVAPWTLAILLAVICGFCLWEFYGLAEKMGLSPMKWPGTILGLLFFLAFAWMNLPDNRPLLAVTISAGIGLILCLFILIVVELYRNKENPIGNVGSTLLGICYIVIPLGVLFYIPYMAPSEGPALFDGALHIEVGHIYKPWVLLCYIFIIWINDIGAYLVGVTCGRHRLFERISPKKSWEGFFGGLVFGVGSGVLMGHWLGQDLLFWAGLALVAVVTGVFGDLVESMFKRAAGVKDSGNVIPGHGGMLDRFDALIFSAPFVFVYFLIFAC